MSAIHRQARPSGQYSYLLSLLWLVPSHFLLCSIIPIKLDYERTYVNCTESSTLQRNNLFLLNFMHFVLIKTYVRMSILSHLLLDVIEFSFDHYQTFIYASRSLPLLLIDVFESNVYVYMYIHIHIYIHARANVCICQQIEMEGKRRRAMSIRLNQS
jgi:hypothetical protein